jgi:hypothetical protein
MWLALAVSQSEVGRLQPDVRDRAFEVIDSDLASEVWEFGGENMSERRHELLGRLRQQLSDPQPTRRRLRRPWRYLSDLVAGDLLVFTAEQGREWRFVVTELAEANSGLSALMRRVDEPGSAGQPKLVGQHIAAYKRRARDLDWADVGFTRTPTSLSDWPVSWMAMNGPIYFFEWEQLARELATGDISYTEEPPPADEPIATILAQRAGQLTVVTLLDGRQLRVYNSTLTYSSGDGVASVIVNTDPLVPDAEADVFQTSDIASMSDPRTDELLFNRT